MALMDYRHMLDEPVSDKCLRCEESVHTMEHWLLECPATWMAKQLFFGTWAIGLEILSKDPRKTWPLLGEPSQGLSSEGANVGQAAQ